MKLVSVNAIFLASCNISLFAKAWLESGHYPPITLFLLSFIFIDLILLLEYEHRQFSKTEVNISESSSLFRRYLFLFAAGAFLTILHKFDLDHYS
jgi:Mg2+/citrate symporter